MRSGDYVVQSWTANDKLAERVAAQAARFKPAGLPREAPTFGRDLKIILAPNDEVFRRATGARVPEWGVGVAIPGEDLVALRAYARTRGTYADLPSVLRHELAHIALHRHLSTPSRSARIPRWFNEGYAMWAAGDFNTEAAWILRVAFANGSAPPLDSLELAWPDHEVDARIAYLLAASIVQYLVNESGTHGLERFLQNWRELKRFDAALARTYGLSLDQLETHWKRDVRRRYGWLAVVAQSTVFVTLAAVGVLALYFVRRRRDRLKLERLRATELPDEPAFWAEPIDPDPDEPDISRHG